MRVFKIVNLIALGINHKTATVEVRERVAFSPDEAIEALRDGMQTLHLEEIVLLSTCNRTEVYAIHTSATTSDSLSVLLVDWLARYHDLVPDDLREATYFFKAEMAIQHIIQVAAGLDSMVLGEPQIFGQLKSAFSVATEAGTTGSQFRALFPKVFSLAKKVRSDTAIGENPVSVAYTAVDLANRIFSALVDCNVLLIGAGETIELVARHLIEAGIKKITIANRTLGRARELGEKFSANAILLSEIPEYLSGVDIVITSTGSQLPILGKGAVEQALRARKRRPILMIDLAVPRDIETQVGDLRDVYLYTIDDLSEIVEANKQSRRTEARKADEIIEVGVERITKALRILDSVDTVKEYRQMAEQIQNNELSKAIKNVARGENPEQVLVQLAKSLTNKLIHSPTVQLRQASAEGELDMIAGARKILGLDDFSSMEQAAESDVENNTEVNSDISIGGTSTLQ